MCWLSVTAKRLEILLAVTESSPTYLVKRDAINQEVTHILNDYGNKILRLAYSYLHNMSDAEDILQDTLIQLLKTKPVFKNESHKLNWLLHVAANLSKNKIKANAHQKASDIDELAETLSAEQKEDLSFVWEAIKTLPEKYREVIHLFYYEGYSIAKIAKILSRNEITVRSDLRRGRLALKEMLKEEYDFE
ncbi:MAG: sigma-70 family RNA polymerase sigma factor [Bacilli bacterium]|nr:sigma-70 family RNA polymerase sigma factor [Bacilli bacterium]